MAGIADSVRKSIQDFEQGDIEFSMMHACNAVDGTSRKLFPEMRKAGLRFTRVLRDNYQILGPLGMPGVNLETTRWPVAVKGARAEEELPDLADLIYGIHRCTHGHGDDLPDGFQLIREANSGSNIVTTEIRSGTVRLSDCAIFAMLAIAVTSPINSRLRVPDGFYLSYRNQRYLINEWWGRRDDFLLVIQDQQMPSVHMNFAHLMDLN